MFGLPGTAYVYFIYGMHHCFNVVTEPAGVGAAVLIRGLATVTGPGRLCRDWGIHLGMNGWDLTASPLRILAGETVPDSEVAVGPRVGISRAAELELRYRWVRESGMEPRLRTGR